jgi:hypothetical protein
MKPGAIVSINRSTEGMMKNSIPQEWFKEEKWKRINDWVAEIEKETLKNRQELALLQTRRIQGLLSSIQNKEKYKEEEMPAYFIADLEKMQKRWEQPTLRQSNERVLTLEEENELLKKEIQRLDEMNKKIRNY